MTQALELVLPGDPETRTGGYAYDRRLAAGLRALGWSVRVHSLANPRHNKALASLCETLNTLEICYPGTDLTMVYEAPPVA